MSESDGWPMPTSTDGTGFTVPLEQTPTEVRSNLALSFVPRTGLGVGVCATSYFEGLVGDQSTQPLGNPVEDCR